MKLKSLSVPEGVSSQVTHPHTTVQALHKELQQKKVIYEARVAELSAEIQHLKKPGHKQLAEVTNQPVLETTTGAGRDRVKGQEELLRLKREYQQMRRERDGLARQVDQLQGQLSERNVTGNNLLELGNELEKVAEEKSAVEQQVCASVLVCHMSVLGCAPVCMHVYRMSVACVSTGSQTLEIASLPSCPSPPTPPLLPLPSCPSPSSPSCRW